MADPTRPAGDQDDPTRAEDAEAGNPQRERGARDGLLAPPTDEELAATGEPTAEEIHAAAAETDTRTPTGDRSPAAATTRPTGTEAERPAGTGDRSADTAVLRPAGTAAERADPPRTEATPTTSARNDEERADGDARRDAAAPVPPAPTAGERPVLAPAEDAAPPAPRRGGNRLAATAWVLLAAGLFQVLYFGALALIIVLLSGPNAVVPGLTNIARFPFAWLPVLFFFLLFELTVLLLNRAGRFAYVVASLVVGFLVYLVSVLLISILVGGGIGDTPTLARTFESPEFILTGLVAREVMLWTGFAIGARGTRVRRRYREARAQYDQEVADARG